MNQNLDQLFFQKLFHHIQDGIIVMDSLRTIVKANHKAKKLLGWEIGDHVPYCAYCQNREIEPGKERCYLIENKGKVPYFSSEIQALGNYMLDVEMSTVLIYHEKDTGEKYYLLVLRDQTLKKKEAEAQMSKKMIKMFIEGKESEHKRLSQELHDGVGQSLYSITIAMDNIIQKIEDDTLHDYIDEVRQELGKVISDVKHYSYTLSPRSLDQLGLIPTLESFLRDIQEKLPQTSFHLSYNYTERLHAMVEINLYRITQEAVHNIMKYAQAKNVYIRLQKNTNNTLNLSIKDDGLGFDMNKEKNGLGLLHMKERISLINGTIDILSEIGQGTEITATVPLEEKTQ